MSNKVSTQAARGGFLRTFTKVLVAGAMVFGLGQSAQAADWYFGVTAGPMMIDTPSLNDPTNVGLLLGREWSVGLGDVGLEGEFTATIDEGSLGGQDVSISTQALYAAFRSAGALYLIGKVGVLREEVEIGAASATDTGASVGAGVGLSLGIARVELQYTVIESDVAYVSLGLRI